MIQETSRIAYHSIDNLGERQAQVFEVISKQDRIHNLKIAKILNLPINSITPRVKELREKGLVVEAGKFECPETGRLTIYWTAKKGQSRLFI